MSKSKLSFIAGLATAAVFFVVSVPIGVMYTLDSLLYSDAETMGMTWTRHMQAQIPRLAGMTDSNERFDAEYLPTPTELSNLLNDVIASGSIYQVDIINPVCLCEITIGGFQNARNSFGLDDAHSSHHASEKHMPDLPPVSAQKAEIEHIFLNRTAHEAPMQHSTNNTSRPIDRSLVHSLLERDEHRIFILSGDGKSQPGKFAEVYHPAFVHNEPAYMIRVLVNLDEKAANYLKLILSTGAIVTILAVLSFAYPARKYLKTLKKKGEADARAHFLAETDVLTDIANRNAFQDQAPKFLDDCRTRGKAAILHIVDVNNFKTINDYHGHATGDQVLQKVAQVLAEQLADRGLLARIGGDEFAILTKDYRDGEILDMGKPIELYAAGSLQSVIVTLSAGQAKFPRDGADLAELMKNADLALYETKKSKTGRVTEFNDSMGEAFKAKVDLFEDFRNALSEFEIIPHYQPIINLGTGKVIGLEALARWAHPQKGIISPAVFHAIFEDSEISARLGMAMITNVLRDMGRWQEQGVDFEGVGINIGEGDLMRPGFVLDIAAGLARYNLPRGSLAIEVSENCLFGKNKEAFINKLRELRALGCFVVLDDFGTGFSSITQLKELPLTTLKIDKSFVDSIIENSADKAIVGSVIQLSTQLGFKIIAEGVETRQQHDLLKLMGCGMGQGYFYSKPVPASKVPGVISHFSNGTNGYTAALRA